MGPSTIVLLVLVLVVVAVAASLAGRFLFALAVFAGFWFFGYVAQNAVRKAARFRHLDPRHVRIFGRVLHVTFFIVGAICGLGTAGVDVKALVAGLGLTGFALGFALKDIISNLLAGLLLLVYRPFKLGDRIKVGAFEGRVESVDLRYTTLQADGRRLFVPNSMLFTNAITVFVPEEEPEAEQSTPQPE